MTINEIQVGRYNGLLHKLLDMKEGAPAPSLAPEIVPALILESDRPEWAFLKGERLCMGRAQDVATAGQYSSVGLQHVGTRGLLVVLEDIYIINGGAGVAGYYLRGDEGLTTADSTGGAYARDSGHGWVAFVGAARPSLYTNAVAPGEAQLFYHTVAPNSVLHLQIPFVLRNASAIWVTSDSVNVGVHCNFLWRERILEASELR